MCVGCARHLLASFRWPARGFEIGAICPTPGCSATLLEGYRCLIYESFAVVRTTEGAVTESESRPRTFSSRCVELQQIKARMTLNSPCDRCVNTGEFKSTAPTILCPSCGFFAEDKVGLGFSSKYAPQEKNIIEVHHGPFVQETLRLVAPLVAGEALPSSLDADRATLLSDLGFLDGGLISASGSDAARKLLVELGEMAAFSDLWGDRLKFIFENGSWRAAPILRGRTPPPEAKRVLVDTNGLRECLSRLALDEVRRLAADSQLTFEEAVRNLTHRSRVRAVMIAALRGHLSCIANQILEAELSEGLRTTNPRGLPSDQYDNLWAELTGQLIVYDLDRVAFSVASTLVRLYVEVMPEEREPDIKDAYHYVFAVQHGSKAIVTGDHFLLSLPRFIDKILSESLTRASARAVQLYAVACPRMAFLFGPSTIRSGFEVLLSTRLPVVSTTGEIDTSFVRTVIGLEESKQ
jgi:hypothetical protein